MMQQYIDKAAVVAEIEKKLDKYGKLYSFNYAAVKDLESLLNFLNALKVKEVDLEKELSILDNTLFDLDEVAVVGTTDYITVEDVKDIAKHFFELGLNAKRKK